MKSILSYVLTRREKIALLVIVLLALLAGWYIGIYTPIQNRITEADTTDLESQMELEQMKSARIKSMQTEIDENKAAGAPIVPTYNNFKQELDELNQVYGHAYDFDFAFSEPQWDGQTVRRDISVSCRAENYDGAVELMRQILKGPYRSMIHDVSIISGSLVNADFISNIKKGRVFLSFTMTYFETTADSESLEGLPQQAQADQATGLAGADLSNLQRSDLETAAEAAFGE